MLSEILGYLGGISVIVSGLIVYFGKGLMEYYQNYLEVTNKRVDAVLDRANHVSKTHFDKEFLIYQEVWEKLVPLRQYTLSLRPVFDSYDPSKSEEERIEDRLSEFHPALIEYRDVLEKNRPFYEVKVYESLNEILKLCYSEAVDYKLTPKGEFKEYWKSQKENRDSILTAIDESCELIRTRIQSLSVIEN